MLSLPAHVLPKEATQPGHGGLLGARHRGRQHKRSERARDRSAGASASASASTSGEPVRVHAGPVPAKSVPVKSVRTVAVPADLRSVPTGVRRLRSIRPTATALHAVAGLSTYKPSLQTGQRSAVGERQASTTTVCARLLTTFIR